MAIIFADGMDGYSSSTDMFNAGWAIYNGAGRANIYTTGGRFNTGYVTVEGPSSAYGYYIARNLTISASTIFIQFSFKHLSLGDATAETWIELRNNGATDRVCKLVLNVDGSIELYNAANSFVEATSPGIVKDNVWQTFALKCIVSNTGTVDLYIDGDQVINNSSIDTQDVDTDVTQVRFLSASDTLNSEGVGYDDIVIMDDSGSAPTNNLISDYALTPLLPNADTAQADWTLSGGVDGYALVDDTMPGMHDSATTSLSSSTAGHKSLFDFENLSVDPSIIYALIVNVEANKSDGGARTMRAYIDSNGTTANGDTWTIGTDFEVWSHIWYLDPDTGTAWVQATVNALKAGIEVVA